MSVVCQQNATMKAFDLNLFPLFSFFFFFLKKKPIHQVGKDCLLQSQVLPETNDRKNLKSIINRLAVGPK